MANDGSTGYPDAWGVHLMTDDIQGIADAAGNHGGAVGGLPPMEVAENGSFAMIKDAGGFVIGAWQPNEVKGFEVTREPGTPSWFELHTSAYDAAVSFYREVFGWDTHVMSDTDEFRYTRLGRTRTPSPGSCTTPPRRPAGTSTSRSRTSTRRSREVTELGGTIVEPAQDTPYGRLARVKAPDRHRVPARHEPLRGSACGPRPASCRHAGPAAAGGREWCQVPNAVNGRGCRMCAGCSTSARSGHCRNFGYATCWRVDARVAWSSRKIRMDAGASACGAIGTKLARVGP